MLPCYVLVDLETTGGNPVEDRITEIAAIRVENGEVVERWQSLVDPQRPIPPFVQRLTGISPAMVSGAPRIETLLPRLLELLDGAVLVAHNARFDHGFLKNAAARAGLELRVRTLCTVRLARRLYPHAVGHGLDALLRRHGLDAPAVDPSGRLARHRAMGDAEALRAWLAAAAADLGAAALRDAAAALLRSGSSLPPQLDTVPEALPQGPGVYLFHGDETIPLYIGKAVNLRRRVLQHFQADHADAREMRIAQQLRRVECIETVGEFGALLLEARLVKQWQPLYNRQLRRSGQLCSWQLADDAAARPQLRLVRGAIDATGDRLYGVYRSRRQAVEALREIAERDALCLRALGLEAGSGRCFAHQLGRCRGVCCGDESAQQHHARLRAALAEHRLQAWPWRGAIALRERGAGGSELHVFDDWRHLGSAPDEAGARALLAARQPLAFDLDTYRLLLARLRGAPDVLALD